MSGDPPNARSASSLADRRAVEIQRSPCRSLCQFRLPQVSELAGGESPDDSQIDASLFPPGDELPELPRRRRIVGWIELRRAPVRPSR